MYLFAPIEWNHIKRVNKCIYALHFLKDRYNRTLHLWNQTHKQTLVVEYSQEYNTKILYLKVEVSNVTPFKV